MSQDGVSNPQLRASDADRERIVEELRRHTADGRLTMEEFEERMAAAYSAKTYGELAGLTRDLPVDLGARAGAAGTAAPRRPPVAEVTTALAGAALNWSGHERAARHLMRARRHQQRLARRGMTPGRIAAVSGWASMSVLLTGIWLLAGLASGGGFGAFWPIWPIGFGALFILTRVIARTGGRR